MRLAARSRIIGALALAVTAAALSPGTSAGYRLTHQEIARLARQSQLAPQSVGQAPVVRPNPDQQAVQAAVVEPPRPIAASAPTANAPGVGFAFGDAAVGAGIAAAIVLLAGAVILTIRRRSQPQHS